MRFIWRFIGTKKPRRLSRGVGASAGFQLVAVLERIAKQTRKQKTKYKARF
jgi:hypothetical protein